MIVKITNLMIGATIVGLGSLVGYMLAIAWLQAQEPVTQEKRFYGFSWLQTGVNTGQQPNEVRYEDSYTPSDLLQPVSYENQQVTRNGYTLQGNFPQTDKVSLQ